MIDRRTCLAGVCLLAAVAVARGGAAADIPVILEGPEVLKLDWNTRSLSYGDLNNNGRLDFALINNDRGSVEMLFRRAEGEPPAALTRRVRRNRWEPVVDSAAYDRRTVVTGQVAHALETGDFNGSGRLDLAFTGNRVPLTILYQDEEGEFTERWETRVFEPRQWPGSIRAVDLNNNGRTDLVVIASEDILLFYQNEEGGLDEPVRYRLASSSSAGLRIADIDGDGVPDIAYLSGEGTQRHLAVRFQYPGGGFGPEYLFPMDVAHSSHLFFDDGQERPLLVYAEQRTGIVRTARLALADVEDGSLSGLQARSYALPSRLRDAGLYATGDFNGSGRRAVVAANPGGAEVLYFAQNKEGDFAEAAAFPSFSSISALHAFRHPRLAADALVVASGDEGLVGVSRLTEAGRFTFPSLIAVEGRPLLVCAGPLEAGGDPAILILEKRGRDFFLTTAQLEGAEPFQWETRSFPLEGQSRDPRAMFLADVDGREPHLVVVGQRETVRIFRVNESGLHETAVESDLRRSLLGDVEPNRLTLVQDGDGEPPLWLLAGSGFVRVLRYEDGDFRIEDQFNARSGSSRPRLPLRHDGEFLVFDADSNELHIHRPDRTGVMRFADAVAVPPVTPLAGRFIDLSDEGDRALVIFGEERFMVLPLDRPRLEFADVFEPHETDLEDLRYMGFDAGDFTGDGRPDLVAIDAQNHIMEILGLPQGGEGWRSYLHFTLFDRNVNMGPRRGAGGFQPREARVGDFTGDGRPDIALLIHDRLLIYPGVGR
ncbi:MAG: VCBS repeat-containing protein [Opitutales bacterium]|nr:VCBS repeat-containing protein [Opitutales bacterium]